MTSHHPMNKQLYWDGYGLWNEHSGVGFYARSLSQLFVSKGIYPTVLLPHHRILRGYPYKTLLVKTHHPRRLSESKIFWPYLAQSALIHSQKNQRLKPNHDFLIHGLSNMNISPVRSWKIRIRKVITVHDIIPLLVPEGVSRSYLWQFKIMLPRVLEAADVVICVSEWTRQTLMERFPKFSEKYEVVANGFPTKLRRNSSLDPQPSQKSLQMITVSRWEDYKNLPWVLAVLRAAKCDMNLAVVTDSQGVQKITELGHDLINRQKLKIYTQLGSQELERLYLASHVYVHPSRYEGFCLPAADALNYGLPVVYRSGSGIDETVGSVVGLPMHPDAPVEDWVRAVEQASLWRETQTFSDNLTHYLASVATWEHSAYAHQKCYEKILGF
jgi:glycosyltransferase involved in cell wall biosynthesis